jgi:hypothetical protein
METCEHWHFFNVCFSFKVTQFNKTKQIQVNQKHTQSGRRIVGLKNVLEYGTLGETNQPYSALCLELME